MMLYFSVPLILVQILLCFLCYPQVVRHYREKTDYSMEQSVSQAISFTESYLRNMTYLANMVEDNGVIQNTLSADGFGEERPYMEQWLEYYELNKEFNSYEISNSVYRFCLYVPDVMTRRSRPNRIRDNDCFGLLPGAFKIHRIGLMCKRIAARPSHRQIS